MEQTIDVVADILAVRWWYPEQHGNDRGGKPGSEILHIIEAGLTLLSIKETRAEVPDFSARALRRDEA